MTGRPEFSAAFEAQAGMQLARCSGKLEGGHLFQPLGGTTKHPISGRGQTRRVIENARIPAIYDSVCQTSAASIGWKPIFGPPAGKWRKASILTGQFFRYYPSCLFHLSREKRLFTGGLRFGCRFICGQIELRTLSLGRQLPRDHGWIVRGSCLRLCFAVAAWCTGPCRLTSPS